MTAPVARFSGLIDVFDGNCQQGNWPIENKNTPSQLRKRKETVSR